MPCSGAVYLVDGSAQLHRAYFAIRGLATSRGLPTNATYGFTTMLQKLLQDEQPEWLGICFDVKGPTFRHEEYPEYKAHRPRMDDDLAVQIPYVRRVCEVFRLPVIEAEGVEADDVIATLSRQAVEAGLRVVVVTGDKDLLQIVSEDVRVLNPGREGAGATLYDAKAVEAKLGVPPNRVVDLLALMGDQADNVPGVRGIGEKGARSLIGEFGSLESVLENADKVKRKAYREGLTVHRDEALLSKRLVTLKTDVSVHLDLERLRRSEPDRQAAHALFTELEFAGLAREIAPPAAPTATHCRVVTEPDELTRVVAEIREAGRLSLSLQTTTADPMRGSLEGLALAWTPGQAVYVPVARPQLEITAVPARDVVLAALRPLLEAPGVAKLSARGKHDQIVLNRCGVGFAGLAFDAFVAAYLLDPGRRSYSLEEMAREHLGEEVRLGPEVRGSGAPVSPAAERAAAEAELTLRLSDVVLQRLEEEGLADVFESTELPIVGVLAEMEIAGVLVDCELLAEMSRDLERQTRDLTREIHSLAGTDFNVNSPAQLREVLFERLGLRKGKKTAKTRAASTAEDVLEELALEHELPRKMLDYRGLQKLKSTYVDVLPQLVLSETGRIHASFNQTVAATGRISSSDPNLQNIPIRTPAGRRIREAFVAQPGHLLLSADYSQIELRILAHLSQDETLIETFARGEDVHDRTSREIFGPLSPIPPEEQRRRSKMINYALIYGKTAFTLARDLGVSRRAAEEFIEAYFSRYPGVRRYIDTTIAEARTTGLVRTLLGRLRRLPDLQAKRSQVRMEAERQARNTPVQGSAADLIKKAMVELASELRRRGKRSRLILQIHDELLLEVPEDEAPEILPLVTGVMEGALKLDVPLIVDARMGRNWAEAH
jgi:DNA polymerase-1